MEDRPMVLFLFALLVSALGLGVYAHYNPGVQDISVRTYHYAGVPTWMLLAGAAGVPLFLFLVHAVIAAVRIRLLRRANERLAGERSYGSRPFTSSPFSDRSYNEEPVEEPVGSVSPQRSPKRSWTTSGD
jgi:hypothetical protein